VRTLESDIYSFTSRRKAALPALAAAETGFHALGVAEAYLTLWLLGIEPTLFVAFLLETTNRLITVVFKFVPLRVGIDEAATAVLTQQVLGLGARAGLVIAIVRKVRMLFWGVAGGLVMVREGITPTMGRADPPA
jgi:hypothetical protein